MSQATITLVHPQSSTGKKTSLTDVATRPEHGEVEQFRTELTGYCYRMLGSAFEAEDAVQETMVRAWKSIEGFEGRSQLRSWLYRIATNVCLTMLESGKKRARPMDFGPSSSASTPIGPRRPELPWMEPIPDSLAIPATTDPAEVAALRESIRLAFVVALQHLPPRQRAVLILCEVLRWKADEVATLLDTTVASVNSALQRARATVADVDSNTRQSTVDIELVNKYAEKFETYDIDGLVTLLHDDVVMSMPPFELWLEGPTNVGAWHLGQGQACRGSRLLRTEANGRPAFAQYKLDPDGGYSPWAIFIIESENGKVKELSYFLDVPNLYPLFGLPMHLDEGFQPTD